MIHLLQIAAEISQADPLKDFQSWFFGSVAVLFIGLLVFNLLEMKQAIKALTTKSHVQETDIALIKQSITADEEITERHDEIVNQINKNFDRLNQTLVLLTADRNPR